MTITVSTFNNKLASMIANSVSLRQDAQSLIEFGLEQYKEHGDTGYLSRFVHAANSVRTLPARTLKDYIKAHANVQYVKNKAGDAMVFKKEVKGEAAEVLPLEQTWWDWKGNKNNDAIADFNLTSQIKSLVTRLTTAEDEGKSIKMEDLDSQLALLTRHIDSLKANQAVTVTA